MKPTVHLLLAAALTTAGAWGCSDSAARPAGTGAEPRTDSVRSSPPGPGLRNRRQGSAGRRQEAGVRRPGSAPASASLQREARDDRHPSSDAPHRAPLTDHGQGTAQPVFRPSDNRPRHDVKRLAKLGIRKYESKRLILYTDIDSQRARTLPAIIDRACEAWDAYFGTLPPDREGAEFQVTGYVMADKDLFRRAGLVPEDLPRFLNGRHQGYEFWMHDQPHDYYLRHLMIHEATHCFMYAVRDVGFPAWYMEGMAELFGTHGIDETGRVRFGVMPEDEADFVGFGRIEMVRTAFQAGRGRTAREVMSLAGDDYLDNDAYGWSWALCKFFDAHPRYRTEFRRLGRILTSKEFTREFQRRLVAAHPRLETEWAVFASGLEYGYDLERAVIEFRPGRPIAAGSGPVEFELETDRGWQSSGVHVEKGRRYEITASGRFTLAEAPRPWISEPQGVSILYADGRPLGLVLAAIHAESAGGGTGLPSLLDAIPVGRGTEFAAPISGTLYFRVNDRWSDLANNTGRVLVRTREVRGNSSTERRPLP